MFDKLRETVMFVLVMFISFPVHESAHALTAHWLGDDTGKHEGRISLNPFRHLDLFGTLMMIFVGFGWAKPVPVRTENFKNQKVGMALTSLAGPVSNLILAYLFIIIYRVVIMLVPDTSGVAMAFVMEFILICAFINVALAVFNLVPIPPLDGSRLITLVFPERIYFRIMKYEKFIFLGLIVLIYSGILDPALSFMQGKVFDVLCRLSDWVVYVMLYILGL